MKVIDIFSGAGGLSVGFEQVGFTTVLAIDKWEDAIRTFNANHKYSVGTTRDIHEFTNRDIEKYASNDITGIIGGPPCQGFSLVGTRDTNDPRNSLYIEYVRFVNQVRPKFFVLENVSGLISLEKGKFKEDIIKRFTELGYNVDFKLLTASDYGVPQSRKRVFFVGLRKDIFGDRFFDFNNLVKRDMVSTKDAISDLPKAVNHKEPINYENQYENEFQKQMRKDSVQIYNHEITNHTKQTIDIISLVPDGGGIKDLDESFYKVRNYNNAFKRMNSKLPSSTIDCGHRNYFHYKENRVPTVRESARIQSFPDKYEFKGSKTSQYTQVGNAVPPLLAKTIAKELKRELQKIIE